MLLIRKKRRYTTTKNEDYINYYYLINLDNKPYKDFFYKLFYFGFSKKIYKYTKYKRAYSHIRRKLIKEKIDNFIIKDCSDNIAKELVGLYINIFGDRLPVFRSVERKGNDIKLTLQYYTITLLTYYIYKNDIEIIDIDDNLFTKEQNMVFNGFLNKKEELKYFIIEVNKLFKDKIHHNEVTKADWNIHLEKIKLLTRNIAIFKHASSKRKLYFKITKTKRIKDIEKNEIFKIW